MIAELPLVVPGRRSFAALSRRAISPAGSGLINLLKSRNIRSAKRRFSLTDQPFVVSNGEKSARRETFDRVSVPTLSRGSVRNGEVEFMLQMSL